MSLVHARKFGSLIYCISDTSSFVRTLNTRGAAIEEPFVKFFPISNDVAFAFAGNSYFADKVSVEVSPDNLERTLSFCAQLSGGDTDFLLIDRRHWSLKKITASGVEDCSVATIGSKTAHERLQRQRLAAEDERPTVNLYVVRLPEGANTDDAAHFSKDLLAFLHTLEHADDCGGVAIPYAWTAQESGYGTYARNVRAPLSDDEIAPGEERTISFADEFAGGYTISFGGAHDWFAYHIVEARFGLLYELPAGRPPSGTRILGILQPMFIEELERRMGETGNFIKFT